MSQLKINDYFSTRKRTRQDEGLLNKEKRLKSCDPPITRITRSSKLKQLENENSNKEKTNDESKSEQQQGNEKQVVEQQPVHQPAQQQKPKRVTVEELKQRMQNFNQKLQKHKEKYEEVTKQVELNNEKENDALNNRAFIKYDNLASIEGDSKLILPIKYKLVFEMFKSSDTIVKFINNRHEVCTFLKLKNGIQNITKKNFTHNNLGQIKTVYPTAYVYKQEKLYIDYKNDYHLTIAPNFEPDIEPNENGVKVMTPQILLDRLGRFKTRLFDIVKDLHTKFLKKIGCNIDCNNGGEIKRWHAKFDLESCDDIVASELPQAPNELKVKSGQDLVNIAKQVYSERVQTAINTIIKQQQQQEQHKEKTTITKIEQQTQTTTTTIIKSTSTVTTSVTLNDKKQNNYNALLEKIKAKEKQKDLENMVKNSDKEKRLSKLEMYKESVRFIKSYFQAEKKCTIDIELVCTKMCESIRNYTIVECEQLVRDICTDLSNWLSIIKLRKLEYVKMNKDIEINEILTNINNMIDQLK